MYVLLCDRVVGHLLLKAAQKYPKGWLMLWGVQRLFRTTWTTNNVDPILLKVYGSLTDKLWWTSQWDQINRLSLARIKEPCRKFRWGHLGLSFWPISLHSLEHKFKVTAVDNVGHSAHAVVTVHLEDVNDLAPKFKKKIYQGFMTPDMSRLELS